MGDHALLEIGDFRRVAFEEGKLVHLGSDRAFKTPDRIAGNDRIQRGESGKQLLAEHGDPLAQRGRLGGDVMGAGRQNQIAPLFRALAEAAERGHRLVTDDKQGTINLELLDVFREVARGHALVDLLVAGKVVEFLDAGLHVMPRDFFPRHDRGRIDAVFRSLVGGDRLSGDVETEVALSLHHGDPEFAFEDDAALCGPNGLKDGRGVAFSKDVGNHVRTLGSDFPTYKRDEALQFGGDEGWRFAPCIPYK